MPQKVPLRSHLSCRRTIGSSQARNSAGVTAASDPSHYSIITREMREVGQVSPETRARLAAEAFSTVAAYHAAPRKLFKQFSIGEV